MWTEKDDKDRQSYVCKVCHGNAMTVFKEPMARKPRAKGPRRVRITIRCQKCQPEKTKRVGWLASGAGLRRRLRRRKK